MMDIVEMVNYTRCANCKHLPIVGFHAVSIGAKTIMLCDDCLTVENILHGINSLGGEARGYKVQVPLMKAVEDLAN